VKPNDNSFRSAVGRRVECINFTCLGTAEPRMRIEIALAGARFVIDDCNPITSSEADAVIGRAITRVTVEINDDKDRYWLPARLSIAVDEHTLDLVAHSPIFYLDEDTQMFVRFPVPADLKDDRRGFHNPFGGRS
jgi:hypothetical protein